MHFLDEQNKIDSQCSPAVELFYIAAHCKESTLHLNFIAKSKKVPFIAIFRLQMTKICDKDT